MIDHASIQLITPRLPSLEVSPYIGFNNIYALDSDKIGSYIFGQHNGLNTRVYLPSEIFPFGRTTIRGSLHKYYNNGQHNFNDFGRDALDKVIQSLEVKFGIKPDNCTLKSIEVGVNLYHDGNTKDILENCLMHKGKRFKWISTPDEGHYIQAIHSQYIFKLYDKKQHYSNKGFVIDKEILRVEIKHLKMQFWNDRGIYTLEDMLIKGLDLIKALLVTQWNSIVFFEKIAMQGEKKELQYSNAIYWEGLTNGSLKYQRRAQKTIARKKNLCSQDFIAKLIAKKVDSLNAKKPIIYPLYIGSIVGVGINGQLVHRCPITQVKLWMQKQGTKYLTHSGLKHLYKYQNDLYHKIEHELLKEHWRQEPFNKRIAVLAHNIRNRFNNPYYSEKKTYHSCQVNLLSKFELPEPMLNRENFLPRPLTL